MIDSHHNWNTSFKPLILGFIFSVIFMLGAYRIIMEGHLKYGWLLFTIIGLGILQIMAQLVFFLHLGLETKPRWNIAMFIYTIFLVLALIGGSLWIMQNLNYNLMM
jgi:cytochrome o ubiquinol oxidase operon protein cyoD